MQQGNVYLIFYIVRLSVISYQILLSEISPILDRRTGSTQYNSGVHTGVRPIITGELLSML